MIPILLGILIAATLFGALLWCGYRAYEAVGYARYANLATVLLVIFAMAMLSFNAELASRATGAQLCIAALVAMWADKGWSRLLPFSLSVFGAVLALGLPFS